jgi:hypothetical protein
MIPCLFYLAERTANRKETKMPFQPGESGNPSGRPKKQYSLTSMLREKGEAIVDKETGQTRADRLAGMLWDHAEGGDKAIAQYIINRLEGMPKEHVESETRTVTQIQLVTDDEVSGPPKTEAADTKPD